jgi:hypothetical protein
VGYIVAEEFFEHVRWQRELAESCVVPGPNAPAP